MYIISLSPCGVCISCPIDVNSILLIQFICVNILVVNYICYIPERSLFTQQNVKYMYYHYITFLLQLVNQKCMDDDNLIELVMNSLLGRLVDSSHVVRQMCIRGLGNVASIGKKQVKTFVTLICLLLHFYVQSCQVS